MKYRKLGKSGIEASVVGFGAWALGGWMWGGTEKNDSERAIHAALDAGINLIDTAPVYGFGRSEEIVGKAIRDRRDSVVLATKLGLVWHVEQGDFFFASDEKGPRAGATHYKVYKCLRPETIRYEIEQSLKRLGVDHIDLYQTHWQDSTTPIEDSMAELLKLKQQGKIRAIGCSNASLEQIRRYDTAGELDVDQEHYSMLDREPESKQLPYCAGHDIAFFAYSPLAQGLLTGKVGPDRTFADGDQRREDERFNVDNRRRVQSLLNEVQSIADAHQLTLAQLTIAWTIAQRGCSHALVGARTPEQARENAKAGSVTLSGEELAIIHGAIENHAAAIA